MLYLLSQAVDRAAERNADHEALRCSGESLSYGVLAERSSKLARVLRELGVRRGDRVAIYADKGLAAAVAIYGIMKAGAAYVPLDPTAPESRSITILRDCGVRHVVTEPGRGAAIAGFEHGGAQLAGVVGLKDSSAVGSSVSVVSWEEVEAAPAGRPEAGTMELDLAYVLYTSGSTGVPKGVSHTHRSALSFAEIAADTYGLRPDDRLSNHAPLHFDLSTLDYFASAVVGATTVIIPTAYTRMPASLSQLIEKERLTVLYAVPLALTHLALNGALDQRDLSTVRWVLFGGEPFPPKHLRRLMEALPNARFSNVYGPTEVNGVTYWIVPPIPEDSDDPIPIGRAYGNVELLVAGPDDGPVDHGETGELLVRSPTMMAGYWGRPQLNARAFYTRAGEGPVDDVFYRTGDLVREDADGVLMFLGRKDRQIKTRGYRVELDEVEATLLSNPHVESAATFAVPDGQGSMMIGAAATAVPGSQLDADAVLEHAARSLPAYALPERVLVLAAMPRTSTGKTDRIQLAKLWGPSLGESP